MGPGDHAGRLSAPPPTAFRRRSVTKATIATPIETQPPITGIQDAAGLGYCGQDHEGVEQRDRGDQRGARWRTAFAATTPRTARTARTGSRTCPAATPRRLFPSPPRKVLFSWRLQPIDCCRPLDRRASWPSGRPRSRPRSSAAGHRCRAAGLIGRRGRQEIADERSSLPKRPPDRVGRSRSTYASSAGARPLRRP